MYKLTVLPNLSRQQQAKLEKLMVDFLWCGKRSKIPLKVLQRPKTDGGLQLFDIKARQTTIKCHWIRKLWLNSDFDYAYTWLDIDLQHLIWQCNLKSADTSIFKDSFWSLVLREWSSVHYREPMDNSDILHQILWYNSCIKINGKPFIFKRAYRSGICRFADILKDDCTLMNFGEICKQYGHVLTWLQYAQLTNAIPQSWVQTIDSTCSSIGVLNGSCLY